MSLSLELAREELRTQARQLVERRKAALAKRAFIKYMKVKIDLEDWHAVRDIAVDLEVLEAKLR